MIYDVTPDELEDCLYDVDVYISPKKELRRVRKIEWSMRDPKRHYNIPRRHAGRGLGRT